MAYDIPNISVKITPFQNEDDDLKALMQLSLMQRRAARGASGGSKSGGGVMGTKGDVYLVPDPQNPGMPRALPVPGNYTEARKHNFGVLNALNDRAVAAAFLQENPDIQQAISSLDQLDVASQKAKLDELRTTIVPKYAEKHGLPTEQALGIFDQALTPVAEKVAERKKAVDSASRWDAFTDLLALGLGNVAERIMNPAASDEEIRANAKEYARRRQEIVNQNPYLADQAKRTAAGQGFLERSNGLSGLLANAGIAASEVLPAMAPVFAGASAGAAAGSIAGPIGSLVGGLIGGAVPSAITSQYDYADILEARPDLTEGQKDRVFSEGRTAATLLGGALGAIPGGVGQAVARGAGAALTRAGLTSVGRQASRVGQAVTAEQLAAGAGRAEALAAGRQAASQLIKDTAAANAEAAANRGFLSGYFRNLPFTAAEAGAMNAGFVGGTNAIQNAYGAPTALTSGLGEAFLSGVATAPFLGVFNAKSRPFARSDRRVETEQPVRELLALPPGKSDMSSGIGDSPVPSEGSGGGQNAPVPPSSGTVGTLANDAAQQASVRAIATGEPAREAAGRVQPLREEVSPQIAEFRQVVNPLSQKNWKSLAQFDGMDNASKVIAREEAVSSAVQAYLRNGGTQDELLAHVDSVRKSRDRSVESPTAFLPKDVRDMIKEIAGKYRETSEADVKVAPVAAVPPEADAGLLLPSYLADAPKIETPITTEALPAGTVKLATEPLEVRNAAETTNAERADMGQSDVATEASVVAPDSFGDRGVETPAPRAVAAVAELGAELPVGNNQQVKSGRVGRSGASDTSESSAVATVTGATGADARGGSVGRPSAPAAASRDAAASVRTRKSGDAARKRAGSPVADTATSTGKQPADRTVEDAAMRIFRILQEDRRQASQRAATAEAREEAAIRASEYDPALESEALSVANAQKVAVDANDAVVTPAVKTRKKPPRRTSQEPTAEVAPSSGVVTRKVTQLPSEELLSPLSDKRGKQRANVPQKVVSPDGLKRTMNALPLSKFKEAAGAVLSKKGSDGITAKSVASLSSTTFKDRAVSQPYRDAVFGAVGKLLAKEWTGAAFSPVERRRLNALREAVPEFDVALGLPKEWQDIADQAAGIFDGNAKEAAKAGIEYESHITTDDVAQNITSRLFECM